MVKIIFNGKEIEVFDGKFFIEFLREIIYVFGFCYMEEFDFYGFCCFCFVSILRGVIIFCILKFMEGFSVEMFMDEVVLMRKIVLELIFLDYYGDCIGLC